MKKLLEARLIGNQVQFFYEGKQVSYDKAFNLIATSASYNLKGESTMIIGCFSREEYDRAERLLNDDSDMK